MKAFKGQIVFGMTGASVILGGIASSNLNVLQALIRMALARGLKLTVLSLLEAGDGRPADLPDWVQFKGCGGKKLRFALSLLTMLPSRPLFIFDHVRLAFPLLVPALLRLARIVIFAHGSESWKRLKFANSQSFRAAFLCITNSNFTLRKMKEKIPDLRGVACPLGLSPRFSLNVEIPIRNGKAMTLQSVDGRERLLGERVLLLVARMDPREGGKGHRQLMRIFPKLLEEFPDAQLVFPGPGEGQRDLESLAKEQGIAASVFIPGQVLLETLKLLYQHCYAFVMPSLQEGFGLVYVEAMNYAKPCVGCFEQGAEEIIVQGQTGFLVHHPEDVDELSEVLLRLLRQPVLARQLGINGFERLHQSFTSQHHQERLKEILMRVL